MRPILLGDFGIGFREKGRRPIYITSGELYNWCVEKFNTTQEGEPYHDCLSRYNAAMAEIAAIFNGSWTYTDPVNQQTVQAPELMDQDDVKNKFFYDYNTRLLTWPLFPLAWMYKEDNDENWNFVLTDFIGRVHRFVKSKQEKWKKMIVVLDLQYNPISNYDMVEDKTSVNGEETFTHTPIEKGATTTITAPQVGLVSTTDPDLVNVDVWQSSDSSTQTETPNLTTNQQAQTNGPKTEHYTTTYDQATTGRLESYDVQSGGTTTTETGTKSTTTHLTPSAEVNKFKGEKYEEVKSREDDSYHLTRKGNIGVTSTQEMIEKELALSDAYADITDSFFKLLTKEVFLSVWKGA